VVEGAELRAHGVSLRLGGHALLDQVDLAVQAGEMLVLAGPNAAGKSTLLRVLAGELHPDPGEVTCLGEKLGGWSPDALARRRAVLPQASPLSFPFRVEEVIAMGRYPHSDRGSGSRFPAEVAREVMGAMRIGYLSHRRYTDLSGGERRRVQLARVLAQLWHGREPRFLLLDEHTANLDLSHQHSSFQLLRRLLDRNIGILAIVHDLGLAARYADRLAVLDRGRLRQVDSPRRVLSGGLVSEVFGVQVNLVDGGAAVRVEPAGLDEPIERPFTQ